MIVYLINAVGWAWLEKQAILTLAVEWVDAENAPR